MRSRKAGLADSIEDKILRMSIGLDEKAIALADGLKQGLKDSVLMIKQLDKELIGKYMQIRGRLEEKLGNPYYLLGIGEVMCKPFTFWGLAMVDARYAGFALALEACYMCDTGLNGIGISGNLDRPIDQNGLKAERQDIYLMKMVNQALRLPTFAAGVLLTGSALIDLGVSLITGNPAGTDTYGKFLAGNAYLGHASSIYMKEDRQNRWKPVFDAINGYIKKKFSCEKYNPVSITPAPGYD